MLEGLFKDLSTRFRKENDLSDMTWAIAKNCETFIQTIMEFFEFDYDVKSPLEIYREYSLGDSGRPDFGIVVNNLLFVIESKIFDRNYHFEQYGKASLPEGLKIGGLGIIVNHRIDDNAKKTAQDNHFKDRTWKNFAKFLENKLTEKKFDMESEECLKAYIKYVKEVCSIMEIREIRFNSLNSLFYFNKLIKKVIDEFHRDGFEHSLYKGSFGDCWSGQYFWIKRNDGKTTLYPFFGILYEEDPPSIYFSFDRRKGWGEEVYLKYRGQKKKGEFFNIESTDWETRFKLNEKKIFEFNNSTLDQQERILEEFFNKMLDEVVQYF